MAVRPMERTDLIDWLREDNPQQLEKLWAWADRVRKENVGNEVHLRGLVEISNHCVRRCAYCGINVGNKDVERYRMDTDEILACAKQAHAFGYGTVVLQAGEDYGISREWLVELIRRIKGETPLAVTLSLGERADDDFVAWRAAGADRYLLRFETSDAALYERIHPSLPGRHSDRFAILRRLREIGFEPGSGVMIGIPGQTFDTLADDIEAFAELDLDMIGVGPFLPHPNTVLGRGELPPAADDQQVPNSELQTYKVVALARLFCLQANIPSTTALATLNLATGRELGLSRGANIVMPNLTPTKYRALYEIYPGKACLRESANECEVCLRGRISRMGRTIGTGPGHRKR